MDDAPKTRQLVYPEDPRLTRLVIASGLAGLGKMGLPRRPRPVAKPIRNAALKIGRNAPCPCGCGRKYKQHLLLEQR